MLTLQFKNELFKSSAIFLFTPFFCPTAELRFSSRDPQGKSGP